MSFAAFGLGALDKLVTNLSDTYGTGAKLRSEQREEANADYLMRERMGIQARVEGAKAAGLHPLVAMNYQGGNSPSTIVGGSQPLNSGAYRSDSEAKSDPNIDRINAANARRAEAEADMAELSAHNAYRALATQPGNPSPTVGTGGQMPTESANLKPSGGTIPGVKLVPNEILSSKAGLTTGVHPGATEIKVPGYGTWTVPSDMLNKSFEDVELLKYLAMLGLNRGRLWNFVTQDIPASVPSFLKDLDRLTGADRLGKYRKDAWKKKPSGVGGSW